MSDCTHYVHIMHLCTHIGAVRHIAPRPQLQKQKAPVPNQDYFCLFAFLKAFDCLKKYANEHSLHT
jgi:hypothetical protein